MRRRVFLAGSATAAAGCGGRKSSWRFFTKEEGDLAAAVADVIIPPDELPGGAWAGVASYMDKQLAGPLKRLQRTYREGLAALDGACVVAFGKRFTGLEAAQRIQALKSFEKGPNREFFALLVAHSMQGYYGDPRHGGNREFAGWRSLGIPPTVIRGRSQHDLEKEKQS